MASKKVKGIQIEIGGSTNKLGKALEEVEKNTKSLQDELKGVNALLKVDPSNIELLNQKQIILKQTIEETSEKLKVLKKSQEQVREQFEKGEIAVDVYRDFQREIIATEQRMARLKKELKEIANVTSKSLEIAGQKVKEFGSKVKDTGSKVEELGGKFAPLSAASAAGLGIAITTASSLEDAVNKYIATTGKATNEAETYQKVLKNIHDNNYGEDYADIADKMRIVSNLLGDLPNDKLQSVVEKSYMLEDAYNMDFQETLRGIKNLMYQYGLESDEAFDLFVKGAQEGLNFSNELGDNVAEYVGNFKQAGYSANEYFQLLKNGSSNGAYNLDKVNDAINEATNRLADGSVEKNLNLFSKSTQNLFKQWQKGGATQKEVIDSIVTDINKCRNEQEALTMAATLFGTMGEDANLNFVKSLTSVGNEFENVSGVAKKASDTMYNGTANDAKEATRSIKSAISDLGKILLPIISKIAKTISNVVKKFEGLNNGTKKSIVTIAALVAVVSPLLILIGKVAAGVGTLIKGVGSMITFGGRLVTSLKAMTTAQLANNAAVLANPYVLAAAAVTALVAGMALWINKSDEKTRQMKEETERVKEQTKAVTDEAQAYKDSVKAREESINKSFTELGHYEKLYQELQKIVDQNGNVKQGYESRAEFITSTLSEALGLEISLVGSQIKGYQELTQTFDKVMAKKKALIVLESQESVYAEALKNNTNELKKAMEARSKMYDLETEKIRLLDELKEAKTTVDIARINFQIKEVDKQYKEYEKQYNSHQSTYESYLNTIGMYEGNYQLIHEEKYDQIMTTEKDYLINQASNGQLSIKNIEKLIKETQNNLEHLRQLKKQNNTDIYDEEIRAQEIQLNSLKNSLEKQKTVVNIGNSNITNEWLNSIANQLSAINGKKYEFKKLGDGTVQMYVDGIKSRKPVAEKDMNAFANSIIIQLQNNRIGAVIAGENLIDGTKEGITNRNKQNAVFGAISSFGASMLNSLKNSLKEKSPSKATEEMGEFLDEGIMIGIENKKKEALKTATRFGKDVLSKMQNSLNSNVDVTELNKKMLLEVNSNFTNSKYQSQQVDNINKLSSILNEYLPKIISNLDKDIVLDDGTLVGKMISSIDKELGVINTRRSRGF